MKVIFGNAVKWIGEVIFWLFVAGVIAEAGNNYMERSHGSVKAEEVVYSESNRQLTNPNRGFYTMYGFTIEDNVQEFEELVELYMKEDTFSLSLIQINLRNFKESAITKQGLKNIQTLFRALDSKEKQYIVRFLYDWDGKTAENEPEDIQVILTHMEQLEELLYEYKSMVFTLQGIFVGACGEMHGSVHMTEEGMRTLLEKLDSVSPADMYLSVRTPQQWRILTGVSETEEFLSTELSKRLGLYNDGMMGTFEDTGTYGIDSKELAGAMGKWNREEELEFQEELCKLVPNGGEVIIENPVNDFENAVESMRTMHVTYLNLAYDRNVLDKWAASTVKEEDCFFGMDGLTYVARHLGYRLLVEDTLLDYDYWNDKLTVRIEMRNRGFAPLYKEPQTEIVIRNQESGEQESYFLDAGLRTLAGGKESLVVREILEEIDISNLEKGTYDVYFSIKDINSGCYIALANEQEMQEYGYKLGEFRINPMLDVSELLWDYYLPKPE